MLLAFTAAIHQHSLVVSVLWGGTSSPIPHKVELPPFVEPKEWGQSPVIPQAFCPNRYPAAPGPAIPPPELSWLSSGRASGADSTLKCIVG